MYKPKETDMDEVINSIHVDKHVLTWFHSFAFGRLVLDISFNYRSDSEANTPETIAYNRLSVLRVEHGISPEALADLLGVSSRTIGYLERDEYVPSLDLAFRISELFGQPIEDIFFPRSFNSDNERVSIREH